MTIVSRADPRSTPRRPTVGLLWMLLLALAAGPAFAQSGDEGTRNGADGPVKLFPESDADNGDDGSDAGTDENGTGMSAGAGSDPATSGTIGSGDSAVQVAPLDAPAADAVGLIDAASGGLPDDMWRGSLHETAERGVASLPAGFRSPAARRLAIRFLSSAAPAPAGDEPAAASDFLAARIDALVGLGAMEAAADLAAAADAARETPALRRARTEARLAAGRTADACADAPMRSQESSDPYWQKLLIFCQLVAGKTGDAEFGLSLLSDMGVEDPLFVRLADALLSDETPDLSETTPGAYGVLHAAMALAAGAAPPDAVAVEGGAAAVEALVTAKPAALGLAEAAAWRGVLPPERLATLYAGAEFEPAQLDSPLSASEELEGARARALFFQALSIQNVPAAKAELLTGAFVTAQRDGIYPLAVAVYARHLSALSPSDGVGFFAEAAAHALYVAGAPDRARRWHRFVRARSLGNQSLTRASHRLWMLGRLAGTIGVEEGGSRALAAWEEQLSARWPDAPGRVVAARQQAYLALLALPGDAPATERALADLAFAGGAENARQPNPAAETLMRRAAADGRVGETVMLALHILGNAPPGSLGAGTLAALCAALDAVGETASARTLALEALAAAGG